MSSPNTHNKDDDENRRRLQQQRRGPAPSSSSSILIRSNTTATLFLLLVLHLVLITPVYSDCLWPGLSFAELYGTRSTVLQVVRTATTITTDCPVRFFRFPTTGRYGVQDTFTAYKIVHVHKQDTLLGIDQEVPIVFFTDTGYTTENRINETHPFLVFLEPGATDDCTEEAPSNPALPEDSAMIARNVFGTTWNSPYVMSQCDYGNKLVADLTDDEWAILNSNTVGGGGVVVDQDEKPITTDPEDDEEQAVALDNGDGVIVEDETNNRNDEPVGGGGNPSINGAANDESPAAARYNHASTMIQLVVVMTVAIVVVLM